MRFDGHGRQHLLRVHDRDDERAGPNAHQSPIVGTTAAAQPVAGPIGRERRDQHHVSLVERDDGGVRRRHANAHPSLDEIPVVDPEFQLPIREHDRQQYPNSMAPQRVQRRTDIRLAGQRRITGHDPRRADFWDGEERAAAFAIPVSAPGTSSQQGRPQPGLPRLVPHAE